MSKSTRDRGPPQSITKLIEGMARLHSPNKPKRFPKNTPFEDRFMPEPMSGCFIWIATLKGNGYGSLGHKGKNVLAHRHAYELRRGPIPEGLTIDHLCRLPCCVNPDHMEVVTMVENLRRSRSPWANNARKTHCINGHPLSGDNLYISPRRTRDCRACRTNAVRTYGSKAESKAKARLRRVANYEREREVRRLRRIRSKERVAHA